jgi:hypothetical protein
MRKLIIATVAALTLGSSAFAQMAEVEPDPELVAGENEAIVYFVRPRRVGGAINFWAFVDEIPVGVTRARDYVPPLSRPANTSSGPAAATSRH